MVPANRKEQQDQPPQGFGSGNEKPGTPTARKKFPAALARTLEPGTPPEIFCESS
jgi:hypothetical protein